MVKVTIYVEGGGNSKELQTRCREGFRKLIEKTKVARNPAIVACGSREQTFKRFKTAASVADGELPLLLVDSEDPVKVTDENPDSTEAWNHLKARDKWERPAGVANDQAQLMTTCMETWIMADQQALSVFFSQHLKTSALLPEQNLEARTRDEVQDKLVWATRDCGKDRSYAKGKRSFKALEHLNPETLKKHLPHFRRFISTLERHLKK
ncbi:MAG: DUF4276 family protein [Acidobacteriota bacterium]|nr:DUF4276 family protein [Acidobacteriota bacterium]